ncbi:MBL fold metallo-hydrolase [Alteromonas sp. W364]|jgi:N-acyl-phosphatidylethanolamine-hydrolysing phospholipase D|uniref:MBL fold metallo-hydrolase n=1 Tax=Alteromonas sp. W364 TaxID=3075610 RepID=UPI002888E8CB|nr:MBL fold metallo-hydrolase [Alteromonas sp. W364]MDT0628116.1 MBL fold metallo-hydrolase [Alteromonas sp. W364]
MRNMTKSHTSAKYQLTWSHRLIGLIFIVFLASCAGTDSFQQRKGKEHHTPDGFKNLYVVDTDKSFFDFLEMRLLGDEVWADHPALADQVPQQQVDIARIQAKSDLQAETDVPLITWLGHSMFLIQHKGLTLLTDPIFSNRASPLSFAGPKRYIPHAMDYADLPNIDIVIISHNHYDHLDNSTLSTLAERSLQQVSPTRFFVPLGLKAHLEQEGVIANNITELDWWDKSIAQNAFASADIQALPSQHWSARGLSDRLQTLWASWSINIDGFHIWFAGDTGYNSVQFKEIGERTDPIDLALIPIGAYLPRWFMQKYHVNPDEALKIQADVKASKAIGMHWGTFPLTAEEPGDPVKALKHAQETQSLDESKFTTMAIGETMRFEP